MLKKIFIGFLFFFSFAWAIDTCHYPILQGVYEDLKQETQSLDLGRFSEYKTSEKFYKWRYGVFRREILGILKTGSYSESDLLQYQYFIVYEELIRHFDAALESSLLTSSQKEKYLPLYTYHFDILTQVIPNAVWPLITPSVIGIIDESYDDILLSLLPELSSQRLRICNQKNNSQSANLFSKDGAISNVFDHYQAYNDIIIQGTKPIRRNKKSGIMKTMLSWFQGKEAQDTKIILDRSDFMTEVFIRHKKWNNNKNASLYLSREVSQFIENNNKKYEKLNISADSIQSEFEKSNDHIKTICSEQASSIACE